MSACWRPAVAAGDVGCRWLDELPDLAAGLERDWGITVGDALHGGSAGLVARAINAAGEPVVLNLGSTTGVEEYARDHARPSGLSLACRAVKPDDKADIQALNDQFSAAANRGDGATMAAL